MSKKLVILMALACLLLLALSADGTVIVTGQMDGNITVYDGSGRVSRTYQAMGPVNSVSLTPDASLIAAGSSDGFIYSLTEDDTWSGATHPGIQWGNVSGQ